MASETFATLESMEEIARHLGDKREQLLRTFVTYDDNQIDTATLRAEAGVATGSIHHHLETLSEWGLIREHNTRRYTPGGGSDARQWSLTERGQEFTEEYVGQVPTESVADLTQRVAELEAEVEALREQHEKDMKDMRSRIQSSIKRIKKTVS